MKIQNYYIMVLVVSSIILGCNNNGKTKESNIEKLNGTIKIDGSSTIYPITEAVAEEYRVSQPEVKVTIGVSGTGGGFKKFGRNEVEICNASRPIKQSEIDVCKENKIEYFDFSVAYDGLAVIVNPQNDWAQNITVAELKMIWEPSAQQKITKWSQVRKGWPDAPLHLFGPGTASGTYDYFTEAIVGKAGSSRGDFTASEDDNVLVQGIEGDKYGLGFFGLAYYEENKAKLKIVAVDNGKGPIFPSAATAKDGTYAPLSRPLFIYINKEALNKPEVADFAKFYLENAPSLVGEVGYVPLSTEEYTAQLEKLKADLTHK